MKNLIVPVLCGMLTVGLFSCKEKNCEEATNNLNAASEAAFLDPTTSNCNALEDALEASFSDCNDTGLSNNEIDLAIELALFAVGC